MCCLIGNDAKQKDLPGVIIALLKATITIMQEILSKKDIGERIKKLRVNSGFSQFFISEVLQLSRSNYSQIELGNQFPTFHTLHILARYYGKSYEWLLHGYQIQETDKKNSPEKLHFPSLENAVFCLAPDNCPQLSIVTENKREQYLRSLRDQDFIAVLDTLRIPLAYQGPDDVYRAFTLTGLNLPPMLQPSDLLIGKHLTAFKNLHLNNLYLIITHDDVRIARYLNINSSMDGLVFRNNNTDFIVPFISIQEIWESHGKFTTTMDPAVNDLELNLKRFEQTIKKLERELSLVRNIKSV